MPVGWHRDPNGVGERYWDGTRWRGLRIRSHIPTAARLVMAAGGPACVILAIEIAADETVSVALRVALALLLVPWGVLAIVTAIRLRTLTITEDGIVVSQLRRRRFRLKELTEVRLVYSAELPNHDVTLLVPSCRRPVRALSGPPAFIAAVVPAIQAVVDELRPGVPFRREQASEWGRLGDRLRDRLRRGRSPN